MKSPDLEIEHESSFKNEKPIETIAEDKAGLNRDNFAKNLAINIQNYFSNNDASLTVGLMGDWGSGKTSILNLTKLHLENTDIKIMDFNPWIYSSYNQLVEQFFDELISQFYDDEGLMDELKAYWFKLDKFNLIKSILPDLVSLKKSEAGQILGKVFSVGPEDDSLLKIKDKINEELKNHKIVCIIDDLDRLTSDEINVMFKLIKIVADFNRIVYIIAFDKDVVEQSLEKSYAENFIEKIINVPLEVPLASKGELKRILTGDLLKLSEKHDLILDEISLDSILESHEKYHTKNHGILYFFETVRDIKRFINVLEFNIELIKNEVNFVDFAAITAMQLFKPEVYEKIKNSESLLARCPFSRAFYSVSPDSVRIEQNEFEAIVEGDENIRYVLGELFPKMIFIYDTSYPLSYSQFDAELRICHKNHFKTYFKLNPILKEITEFEMSLAIKLINAKKEAEILNQFQDFHEMYKLRLFLENLMNRTYQFEEKEFFLNFIFEHENDFDDEIFKDYASIFTKFCIKLFEEMGSDDKFEILKNNFKHSNNLNFLLGIYSPFEDWFDNMGEEIFTNKEIRELKNITQTKFRIMLDECSEYVEGNLFEVLDLGRDLTLDSEVDDYIVNFISTDERLLTFLKEFISEGDDFYNSEIQKLSDIVDLNLIKERIDKNYDDLKDEIVVKKFLKGHELWLDDVIE